MSVRNLDQKRHRPLQLDLVYQVWEFSSEFLRQQNHTYILILHGILDRTPEFFSFMYHDSVYPCETHSCQSIDIITDQIHLHLTIYLRS